MASETMKGMRQEKILILDFGGQYKQLIGRRVREARVYCEIKPCTLSAEEIKKEGYQGIILTGGPHSVYEEEAPKADPALLELGIPVLGICYGAQWIAHCTGGRVESAERAEYGRMETTFEESVLFKNVQSPSVVWMSHRDRIVALGEGFSITAHTPTCPCAAFSNEEKKLYGVQFHPEVEHTEYGKQMLHQFLYEACGVHGLWKIDAFVEECIAQIKEKIGDKKAICAFSGGVDSSVAAVLVHRAIGKNLTCVLVDHGLMRKDEAKTVEEIFSQQFKMNFIRVDAQQRFLSKLAGVADPEKKRKIIGEEFIRVFEEEAKKLGKIDYLVQGTIYPDVIESGVGGAVIKSHHNVGGLPEDVGFEGVIEPLRDLFKDEVRKAGEELGIPHDHVWRQPFPGPGLAVRILGEITEEKTYILQEADAIFREEVKKAGWAEKISQYFAVLTNVQTVGVMGDARTYDYTLALRAVSTSDFMTAEWTRLPYELLEVVSNRIVNEVKQISRVVYDITGKPPATIEWE